MDGDKILLLILTVLILALIGLLIVLLWRRGRQSRYEGEKSSVYVQGGMNAKSRKWAKNDGAYFSGGLAEYQTYLIGGRKALVWRIAFENLDTGKSQVIRFQGRMGIGRTLSQKGEAWLCVPDEGVSREHSLIYESNGRLYLTDLKVKNSTKVNGKRIGGAIPLANGDIITFGNTRMRIHLIR